jgi:hypothetical protein
MSRDDMLALIRNLRDGKGTREEAATALESAAQSIQELRRSLAREAWTTFMGHAIAGYLTDPKVIVDGNKERDAVLRNCAELADHAVDLWRARWAKE